MSNNKHLLFPKRDILMEVLFYLVDPNMFEGFACTVITQDVSPDIGVYDLQGVRIQV